MQQQEIHNILERYFTANESTILENCSGYLHVQLSVDLDKLLMNRPFYWHYLEKTGGTPNPMQMSLITDPNQCSEEKKGEQIHFGSPRLHQILQSLNQVGTYIRLYEHIPKDDTFQSSALHPWLCINTKISYQCDRKKDMIISLGLNLITGEIIQEFHDMLLSKTVTPKIPDFCFTLSPLITPKSGLLRLENVIRSLIAEDDHQWAEDAYNRWQKDLKLLETFYEEIEEKPESYHLEIEALKDQYEPKINVHIINGGLFYLKNT
ncbi:hypothetical protein BKP37_15985 [Anaerobacillus alkalilacustris]|uniref:YqhG family protein n=1 Tax=Anaerobacillus alkalilacustris TaxID=393763 RepID=A0A1S2LFK3_9BACI|nr:YqhG family protein [Anaerobacillus alkalilacustris]OIJ11309.1 hypothetical protein BKP37_15985 [Anaerobacillus alkalilacustris]